MLKAGLASLTAGRLPRSSDQIVIGDTQRSRFGAVRHLIFLGLNADLLPKPGDGGGLLTDEERQLLATEECPAYTDERSLLEERFYLHSLLSLPRQSLDLCLSRMDSARKPKPPSSLIREIRALFPDLEEETDPREGADLLGNPQAALRLLAKSFGENDPAWPPLYAFLRERKEEEIRTGLARIEAGAAYRFEPARLSEEAAKALFGSVLSGSVTRLESFASCPYRHFLRYGLSLNEREEFSWESVDHGNFFHLVMETLLRGLTSDGRPVSALSQTDVRAEIRKAVDAALQRFPDFGENVNASYLLSRWESFFERYLQAMASWEAGAAFKPAAFELHFGAESDTALRIPLKDGALLSLQGTIDRLDLYEEDGQLYLRVVDYKTSAKKLDFGAMEQGTQLQLGAYLEAARAICEKKYTGKEVLPGGLYYSLLRENWLRDWKDPAQREEAVRQSFRLQGLTASEVKAVSPDADDGAGRKPELGSAGLALLGRSICRKLKELGERILDGEIAASPVLTGEDRSSCSYCPFTALCDRKDEAFSYREQPRLAAEDYLNQAKEAEKDGLHG